MSEDFAKKVLTTHRMLRGSSGTRVECVQGLFAIANEVVQKARGCLIAESDPMITAPNFMASSDYV